MSLIEQALIEQAFTRASGARLLRGNAVELFADNARTFECWLDAIHGAQRWVHLENYIFHADHIGHRFADALQERARAGVPVRVIYDWFGSLGTPRRFWRRLRQAGVEVRAVSSPHPARPLRLLSRDHRKLVAVDGEFASAGGVCIGDEWLIRDPRTGLPFRDTAVVVRGPAVAEFERAFARLWDRRGPPLPAEERGAVDPTAAAAAADVKAGAPAGDTAVRVIAQEPGRVRISRLLDILGATVRERLWIADAYYLAMPSMQEAIAAAARDGVDVRMLMPRTSDLFLISAMSRVGYRPLLEAGVRIFEYDGPMMHAKTMVADGWWSRVGSTNLNLSGLLANWELDVVVEDVRFAAQMEAMFERDLLHAREVRLVRRLRRPRVRAESADAVGPGRVPAPRRRPGRRSAGSGRRAIARVAGLGGLALLPGGRELRRHEQIVGAAISAGLIGLGVLAVLLPAALAWPVGGFSIIVGLGGLLRTLRRGPRRTRRPRTD